MKIRLSVFFLCFIFISAFSARAYNIHNMYDGQEAYVYANVANVRSQPNMTADQVDQLKCGYNVKVIEVASEDETLNGVSGRWLKVAYTKDEVEKQGYIWEGTLSFSQIRRGDVKFVYGVDRFVEDDEKGNIFYIGLKAVKNDLVVSSQNFSLHSGFTGVVGKAISDMGLKKVENIVILSFLGEACGIASNYYYFAWNGNELLPLISRSEVGDAAVSYASESLIFPSEGAPYNMVVKIKAEGYNEDEEKISEDNEVLYEQETFDAEFYRWDGKTLKKVASK